MCKMNYFLPNTVHKCNCTFRIAIRRIHLWDLCDFNLSLGVARWCKDRVAFFTYIATLHSPQGLFTSRLHHDVSVILQINCPSLPRQTRPTLVQPQSPLPLTLPPPLRPPSLPPPPPGGYSLGSGSGDAELARRADAGSEIEDKQNNHRCTRLDVRHEAVRERDGVGEGWEKGEGWEAGARGWGMGGGEGCGSWSQLVSWWWSRCNNMKCIELKNTN